MNAPKAVRITFLGKPLRNVYPHATAWQVLKYKVFRAARWLLIRFSIALAIAGLMFGAYIYGQVDNNVVAAQNVITYTKDQEAPVLARIGDCESGVRLSNGKAMSGSRTQYNKNGQVIRTPNSNGTVDTGMYGINSIWDKQATQLGLDLTKEADNYKMAKWLYENKGTGDWSASQSCWKI